MRHVQTADRYVFAVDVETGSYTVSPSQKPGDDGSGSQHAHSVKECRIAKDAGSQSPSGIEKMSQKTWNLRILDP